MSHPDNIFKVIVTARFPEKDMKIYPLIASKRNLLVKPKSKERSISKTMKATFNFLFIALALNFGVLKSNSYSVNILVKSFYVLRTFGIGFYTIFFIIIPLGDPMIIFWDLLYVSEFFALVLTLLFSKRTTFVEFYENLLSIDVEMGKELTYRPEFVIIGGFTFCFLYRSLVALAYCTIFDVYCISPIAALIIFNMSHLCSDAFLVVYFTIYYTLFCRIKNFSKLMQNENTNILSHHFLYKSIVDVYDKVKVLHNPLYVVPLVFHTIDMMITIFYPLLQMDQRRTSSLDYVISNISVFQVFALLFAPAFASGLLTSQVEKLRLVLMDRALKERNQKSVKDIERFIRYIEARPMKTVIFKIISLDWTLPVSVLNICVTYLIVMLQFTHKY